MAGVDQAAKVRIPSATNTAAYRIPDALSETTLTEVKNVSYLRLTSQLQDFSYYATQTGRQFDLIVRANTVLSGPLEDIVNMRWRPSLGVSVDGRRFHPKSVQLKEGDLHP